MRLGCLAAGAPVTVLVILALMANALRWPLGRVFLWVAVAAVVLCVVRAARLLCSHATGLTPFVDETRLITVALVWLIAGLMVRGHASSKRDNWLHTAFSATRIAMAAWLLAIFWGMFVYGHLPRALGGGRPIPACLYLDAEMLPRKFLLFHFEGQWAGIAESWREPRLMPGIVDLHCVILDSDEKFFYVIPTARPILAFAAGVPIDAVRIVAFEDRKFWAEPGFPSSLRDLWRWLRAPFAMPEPEAPERDIDWALPRESSEAHD